MTRHALRVTPMNFYLLATSAWGVRKGHYSRKRFTAMVNHFETCLERSCNNIFCSNQISRKRKKSIYNACKLYRKGLKIFRDYEERGNSILLLEGLVHIDKGKEKFLKAGKKICRHLNKKII